jgi:hypothetical protein
MQRHGKHIPAGKNLRETIQVLLDIGHFYVVRAEELSCEDNLGYQPAIVWQ